MRGVLRLESIRCVAAFAVAAMLAGEPATVAAQPRDDRTFAGAVDAVIRLLVQPVPTPVPPGDRHTAATGGRRTQRPHTAHVAATTVAPPLPARPHMVGRATFRVAVVRAHHAATIIARRSVPASRVPIARVPSALRVLSAERGDVTCRGAVMQCRSAEPR